MDRRTSVSAPAALVCAECGRLGDEERTARAEGDHSRASDCRVLLARHCAAAHEGER